MINLKLIFNLAIYNFYLAFILRVVQNYFKNNLIKRVSYLVFFFINLFFIISYSHDFKIFILILLLGAIFIIDFNFMIIPDELIILLVLFKFLFLNSSINLNSSLSGALIISLPMIILNLFLQDAFGFGDIKLFFASGFILGPRDILKAFYISVLSASLHSMILLIKHKKNLKDKIAFGPHICISILIIFLESQV